MNGKGVYDAAQLEFSRFCHSGQMAQAIQDSVASAFYNFQGSGELHDAVRSGIKSAAEIENIREAWMAFKMIREVLETLGPVGAVKAEEYIVGGFTQEAEALIEAIQKLTAT